MVLHISFGERSAEGEIQDGSAEGRDPLGEAIGATPESMRRQVEEGQGSSRRAAVWAREAVDESEKEGALKDGRASGPRGPR